MATPQQEYERIRALGLSHKQVMRRMSRKNRKLVAQADRRAARGLGGKTWVAGDLSKGEIGGYAVDLTTGARLTDPWRAGQPKPGTEVVPEQPPADWKELEDAPMGIAVPPEGRPLDWSPPGSRRERQEALRAPQVAIAETGDTFSDLAERLGVNTQDLITANPNDINVKAGAAYNIPTASMAARAGLRAGPTDSMRARAGLTAGPRVDGITGGTGLLGLAGEAEQAYDLWADSDEILGTSLGPRYPEGRGTGRIFDPGTLTFPEGVTLADGLSYQWADQYDQVDFEDSVMSDTLLNNKAYMGKLGDRSSTLETTAEWLSQYSLDGKPITVKDGKLVGKVDWEAALAVDPDLLTRLENFGYIQSSGVGYRGSYGGYGGGRRSRPSYGGPGRQPDYRRSESYLGLTSWSI